MSGQRFEEIGSFKDFVEKTQIDDHEIALSEYSKQLNEQRIAVAALKRISLDQLHLANS